MNVCSTCATARRCTSAFVGVVAVAFSLVAAHAYGQTMSRVDVEAESGFAVGIGEGGCDSPRVGILGAGLTGWVTTKWAVAAGYSVSFHDDECMIDRVDRIVWGYDDLRQWRLGFRHRRQRSDADYFVVGAGIVHVTADHVFFLKRSTGLLRQEGKYRLRGVAGELHYQHRFTPTVSARAGAVLMRDVDFESQIWMLTPSIAVVLTF